MNANADDVVVLTDVRSIRALAHPARIVIVGALYDENLQLSATQAATRAGISPSAMSYHLRALEKAGIVKRAPASADRRERPWERAGSDLAIRPTSGPTIAVVAATEAILGTLMEQDRGQLMDALRRQGASPESDAFIQLAGYARSVVRVTPEEAKELTEHLTELLKPFLSKDRPKTPGSGLVSVAVSFIPHDETASEHSEPDPES